MSRSLSEFTAEQRRVDGKRLVAKLDTSERVALIGLVRGHSRNAIAEANGVSPEVSERSLASMMKKLNARTIIDAVRIGLYAGIDRPD